MYSHTHTDTQPQPQPQPQTQTQTQTHIYTYIHMSMQLGGGACIYQSKICITSMCIAWHGIHAYTHARIHACTNTPGGVHY